MSKTKTKTSDENFTLEETEAVLDQLVASGDVEQFTDGSGHVRYRLTSQGSALADIISGSTAAKG